MALPKAWKPHPFWTRLQALLKIGKLANVDIQAWFNISEGSSRAWRKAKGPYGPPPYSSQDEHWRRLHLLRDAIADRRFPLTCRVNARFSEVRKLFDEYSSRLPKSDPAE